MHYHYSCSGLSEDSVIQKYRKLIFMPNCIEIEACLFDEDLYINELVNYSGQDLLFSSQNYSPRLITKMVIVLSVLLHVPHFLSFQDLVSY